MNGRVTAVPLGLLIVTWIDISGMQLKAKSVSVSLIQLRK